jgi:hypothetical protein
MSAVAPALAVAEGEKRPSVNAPAMMKEKRPFPAQTSGLESRDAALKPQTR